MDRDNNSHTSRELRLDAVIAEVLQLQDRGYQVDKRAFIAQHADLASELEEFFQGIPALNGVADEIAVDGESWQREDTSDTRYSVTSLHASGGIGRIYIAQDGDLRRKVALKSIHPRLYHHPVVQARFLREAQVTGQLEHPNIVPVYELVRSQDGAVRFYTMRLVRGKTLRAEIRDYFAAEHAESRLAFHRLVAAFLNVCYAVDYAHSRSIIHRDLKPDNVMIGKFGEVALMDWGLAKHLTTEDLQSSAVQLSAITAADVSTPNFEPGTPAYMAPEQAKSKAHLVGPRTDIYGLGAILFEMLTGDVPHIQHDDTPLREQIAEEPSPDPLQRRPGAPRALAAICRKAMAFDARDRFASAKLLGDDIERWLADEPVSVFRDPILKRATRWIRRHRVAAATLTGVASAAIVAAFAWWMVDAAKDRRALEETSRLLGTADAAFKTGDLDEAARAYSNAQVRADSRSRLLHLHDRATRQLGVVESMLNERQDFADFRGFVNERLTAAEVDMMLGDTKTAGEHCDQILRRFDEEQWKSRLAGSNLDPQVIADMRQKLAETILLLVASKSSVAEHSSHATLTEVLGLLLLGTEIHPNSSGVWLLKAEFLEALDNSDEANQARRKSNDAPARTAFDFFVLGEIERRNCQIESAIQQYERALAQKPNDFWSHVRLASCWMQLHQPHRALAHFDHALRLTPDATWLRAARAVAYADLQQWTDAFADLEDADRFDPDFYGTSNNRGVIYVRKALDANGMVNRDERIALLNKAEVEFQRSLRQRPSYVGARINIGRVQLELGILEATGSRPEQAATHFQQAESELSAALVADPNSTAALTNRGLVKAMLEAFAGARADAVQAGQLDPRNPEVHLTLGQIAFIEAESTASSNSTGVTEGLYRDAIRQFELAIGLAPHDAAGYWGRARSRFELMQSAERKFEPAAAGLARAVLADLERVESYAGAAFAWKERAQLLGMRATARAGIGDYRNALSDYALALQLEPDDAVRRVRRGWALIMATNEGMADFDEALSEEGATDHRILADAHAGQAYLLAVAGNDRAAVTAAERAVRLAPDHWPTLFNAACSYSLASGTAREEHADEAIAEKYALRAIDLLRQSLANGLHDGAPIASERALVPLRKRTDFAELIDRSTKRPPVSETETTGR